MFLKKSESNSYPVYQSERQYQLENGEFQPLFIGKLRAIEIENGEEDFWSVNTQEDMFGNFFIALNSQTELPYFPSNDTTISWSSFKTDEFELTKVDNG